MNRRQFITSSLAASAGAALSNCAPSPQQDVYKPSLSVPHDLVAKVAKNYSQVSAQAEYSAPNLFPGFGRVQRTITTPDEQIAFQNKGAVHGTSADNYRTLDDELEFSVKRELANGWEGLQSVRVFYRFADVQEMQNAAKFQVTGVELSDRLVQKDGTGKIVDRQDGTYWITPTEGGLRYDFEIKGVRDGHFVKGTQLPTEYQAVVNTFVHEQLMKMKTQRSEQSLKRQFHCVYDQWVN